MKKLLFLISLLAFQQLLHSQCLNGVYTIGGSTPDYANLRAAKNALVSNGVCGPVTFNIRPGTYQDTLTIPTISGVSAVNTITFRSENNDSTSVILSDFAIASTATENYVIRTRNLSYITFSKLSFKQTVLSTPSSALSYLLYINNRSNYTCANIKVLNCCFLSNALTDYAVFASSMQAMQNFELQNSILTNGKGGCGFAGTVNSSNLLIKRNRFSSQTEAGFSSSATGTVTVEQNLVRGPLNNSGISCSGSNITIIRKNQVIPGTGQGIVGYNTGLTSITNNFILMKGAVSANALYLTSTSPGSAISYNTVRSKTTNHTSLYMMYGNAAIKNNLFENKGTGAVYNLISPGTFTISNNRCYTNGSALGYYNYVNYPTLNAWRTATGHDANSQSSLPYFVNDSTYEINADFMLNGAAVPLAAVTDDIEGNVRNTTTPDMGAYEFNLMPNNAGIIDFGNPLDSVLCNGSNPIKIRLRNSGGNVLNTVDINWKLNGIQQPVYNWAGNLASGDTAQVILPSLNLLGGRTNRFVFYSTNPNGVADGARYDDTIKTRAFRTRLSGIYTIGGLAPDYQTFKKAADSLQRYGICGPVIYNFRNGLYKSNFILSNILGSSNFNTVTFQSESLDSSLVIISDTAQYLRLSNVKNFIFNKLTFRMTNATTHPSLSLEAGLSNVTVSNCVFENTYNGVLIPGSLRANISGAASGNIKVLNNRFVNGTNISLSGSNGAKGIIVKGNVFTNGVLSCNAVDSVIISDNRFGPVALNANAIIIAASNKELQIFNNKLLKSHISITNCSGTSYDKKVYNNLVDSGKVMLNNAGKIEVYHNTISYSAIFNGIPYDAPIEITGPASLHRFKNNIITNMAGGVCIEVNDLAFDGIHTPDIFDHNVIYNGSSLIVYTNRQGGTNLTESVWQNVYNQDHHSVFFQPFFTGAHDFHIVNGAQIDNAGTPIPGITTDLDAVLRNSLSPDPGAYEYSSIPVNDDAGIASIQNLGAYCENSVVPVTVTLKNYGANGLTSAQIGWSLNGSVQPSYNWTGLLAPGSATLVTIGTFTTQAQTGSTLTINTAMPNGTTDSFLLNDTLHLNLGLPQMSGVYTIGTAGASYASVADAATALVNNGMCGPVIFKFNAGNYTDPSNAITISSIPGNNSQNTITFESASGNQSSVCIKDLAITLSDINGIEFKNMTFRNSPLTLGANLKGAKFTGNRFDEVPSGFYVASSINSSDYNEDVSFVSNLFSKSSEYCFKYTHALNSAYPKRLTIKGNVFDDPKQGAISIVNVDSLMIDSNYFFRNNVSLVANISAIKILNPGSYFKISGNKISGTYETGINIYAKSGGHIGASSIENNSIIGAPATQACLINRCDSVSIFYNSLHLPGSGNTVSILSQKNKIYNNIFSAQSARLMSVTSPAQILSDYNIFYTTGVNLITSGSATITSLASYSTSTGREVHSYFADPQFVSMSSDLHYQNPLLDGKAMFLASVLTDQQNKIRNTSTPNPGAYETLPDTTIDTVNKSLILTRINTANLTVQVNNIISGTILYTYPQFTDTNTYKYRGAIDSLKISYQVNHLPVVTEKWYGSLQLNDSLQYAFTTPYFVPNGKIYSIALWFEDLNPAHHEINHGDDSLRKSYILPLQGDYTIGGLNPDYLNVEGTVYDLLNAGTTGNVRFLYRTGTYYSNRVLLLNNLMSYNGSVEYTSETGNRNDVKINFTGAGNFSSSLKFSKLTIVPKVDYWSYGPYDGMKLECVGVTEFDSCVFIGGNTTTSKGGLHFLYHSGPVASTIKNCVFKNMLFAVYLSTFNTYCGGPANQNFIFENNVIDSCNQGVIITNVNAPGTTTMRLIGNTIKTYSVGIDINPASFGSISGTGRFEISGNKIESNQGIKIGSNLNPNYYSFIKSLLMKNNMISSQTPNLIKYIANLKMYHNSFNRKTEIVCRDSSEIYNNIFYDVASNECMKLAYSNGLLKSDHNDFYAPNAAVKLMYVKNQAVIPYAAISSHSFTSASQIKQSLPLDSNSFGLTPLYVSSNNLHAQSSNLKNKAKAIVGLTTDIDGDSRMADAGPDVGADEMQITFSDVWPGDADNDLTVTSQDLFSIGLHYGNHGYPRDSISNLYIGNTANNWNALQLNNPIDMKFADCNGDSIVDMNDTLAIHLNYNSVHFQKNASASVSADVFIRFDKMAYHSGDTVKADVMLGSSATPLNNVYGVSFYINYDRSVVDANSEKMKFQGSWIGNVNSSMIKFSKINQGSAILDASMVRINHTDVSGYGKIGTFEFVAAAMPDTAQLHLQLTNALKIDHNGVLSSLSSGVDSVTVLPAMATSIHGNVTTDISVFPNPASGYTVIKFRKDIPIKAKIELMDVNGKVLIQKENVRESYVMDLTGIAGGVYLLKVAADDGSNKVFKLVVQ